MKCDLIDLDNSKMCPACPFNVWTEDHVETQNLGCLPDANMVINFYENNEGHWKCHSRKAKCQGLESYLTTTKHPRNKNNQILLKGDNE